MNSRAFLALLLLLGFSTLQASPEDVVLRQTTDCYIYVPKRVVLEAELPLFDHPVRLPCLTTGQARMQAFSELADDLEVGFSEPVREALIGVVQSTCGAERGFCENRNREFWNRFDENSYETEVQPGHSLGMYLVQLERLLAERYQLHEHEACFSHGTACQLSPEKQAQLMVKAAALKIAGFDPDFESIAKALSQ